MNIVICGAGEVGSQAAEILGDVGHRITVIDRNAGRLRAIEESMDVRTLQGNAADATVLDEAGVRSADMVVAATDEDEVNLLTAAVAKALGARRTLARVHHRAFFDQKTLDYEAQFDIDRLICPEYATALAIARILRNPAAVTIEEFARGSVVMQQFAVGRKATALGKSLIDLPLPKGARLTAITRKGGTFIPDATTMIDEGDSVILVGNSDVFYDGRQLFTDEKVSRQKLVIMGGGPMTVWLCRALRKTNFAIRAFVLEPQRARELAEKLDWVTVLNADPTERSVFDEERIVQADTFISLLDGDEGNIIAGVLAKVRGVPQVITVVQQAKYHDVVYDIGVDRVFSPRLVAGEEIDLFLDERPLRHLGTLAEGFVDVYRVRVGKRSPVIGKPLRDIKLSPEWIVAAIQHDRTAHVPAADDVIAQGDVVLVVGRQGEEAKLKKIFA